MPYFYNFPASSGSSNSPWWPSTASGAAFPTYAEFSQGIPAGQAALEGTDVYQRMMAPGYGMGTAPTSLDEGQINRWFDTIAKENIRKGMESTSQRYADAGYGINPGGMAEASGRLSRDMEGKRSELLYSNAAQGVSNRLNQENTGLGRQAGAYQSILNSLMGSQNQLTGAYAQAFTRGLVGGTDQGTRGTIVKQSPFSGTSYASQVGQTPKSPFATSDTPTRGGSNEGQGFGDWLYDSNTGVGNVTQSEKNMWEDLWRRGGYSSGE